MNQTTNTDSLSPTSQLIFKYATSVDNFYDASTISYEYIAILSAMMFFTLTLSPFKTKNRFEADSFVHAIISGIGSAMCVYLDQYAAEELTGTPGIIEPLGMIRCQTPLTNLHVILPAITLGYSVCDIYQCITQGLSKEFLFHGLALFASAGSSCVLGLQPLVTRALIMELSTILLNLSAIEMFGEYVQAVIQISFVITFFLTRNVAYPYIWYQFIRTYYEEAIINNGKFCFPPFMFYFIFVSGLFFNCLNVFWLYKLIRKMKKKITAKMNVKDTKIE